MPEKKPLKAPQESVDLKEIKYPVLVSMKLDGIRCIVKDGQIFSASMRHLPNPSLKKLLSTPLRRKTWVFDGELYGHGLEFSEISGAVRRYEGILPLGLGFHIFDCLKLRHWENGGEPPFAQRYEQVFKQIDPFKGVVRVEHVECLNEDQLRKEIDKAKNLGYEGVIIRDPEGSYKHGRATVKQGIIFKYKFWDHFDARILSVHEMQGIREGIERVVDPTGHRRAVHKKGDKEGKGTFGYFEVEVDIPGKPTMQIGNWKGLTHELRDQIWANPDDYIGKWIRFEAMAVGQKDVPRIPKNVEFRDEK